MLKSEGRVDTKRLVYPLDRRKLGKHSMKTDNNHHIKLVLKYNTKYSKSQDNNDNLTPKLKCCSSNCTLQENKNN